MKKWIKISLLVLFFVALLLACIAYVATHDIAVLDAKGSIGMKESELIVTASLLMLIVVVPVFILAGFFVWRYREGNKKAKYTPDWEHNYIAEYCWWGVPSVIILVLAIITWKSSHELNPFTPLPIDKKPLTIQAVALQWKWLFIYPEYGIATVNFIQFPEQTPINFEITADAPMNSFWIPALGGQIYAMPAMRSKLHLIANQIGSFRGVSANISGTDFAGMTFTARASALEDFNAWVLSAKGSEKTLNLREYERLVLPSSYQPVSVYLLEEENLFDWILMKYREPT